MDQDRTARRQEHEVDEYRTLIEQQQRNTVWPGFVSNSRALDSFLWRGSSNPPVVQRIGAWLIGSGFMLAGVTFVVLADEKRSLIIFAIALLTTLLGGKIFSNGFPKRQRTRD
jgi:hypothetical protein